MTIKYGWKVTDPWMNSAATINGNKYNINKWTRRKKEWGPLALFRTKKDAWYFLRHEYIKFLWCDKSFFRLFKCAYIPSKDKNLWTNKENKLPWKDLPEGTLFADAICLIKETKETKGKRR